MYHPDAYRLRDQPSSHRHHPNPSTGSMSADRQHHDYAPPQYRANYNPQGVKPHPFEPQGIKPPDLVYGDRWNTVNVSLPQHPDPRTRIIRTPSPTPSEARALDEIGSHSGLINWKRVRSKDFWMSKEGLKYGIIATVVITLVVLFAVYHKDIVIFLTPATQWCHDHKFGWLIPVGLLIILSFPPLFGHELIAMLCGIGWGIAVGFGIVALGTLLGEIANYVTFKYCCTTRARKYENKNLTYACLSRVVRSGGFKIALAARYSLIPPHLTTTVFASSGLHFHIFLAAAVLSLPKQLVTVYIGVLLEDSINGTSKKDKIASIAVAIVFAIVTSFAFRYVNRKMDEVKPQIIYERRKARQAANLKMLSEGRSMV
ncbi:hypothetical protein F5050DRAFT_1771200 [Lentinula boryana]|uniref:Golgi apparatus membrane protein TVP38 n=1 Tax=Lentinula boryana TaxID=40481 RepID=A0ABQ8Q8K0_9AGAR|nr:hypothetical protein F5050DRAFT_1771200 [Lentinula boryana]